MLVGVIAGEGEVYLDDLRKLLRLFKRINIEYALSKEVSKIIGEESSSLENVDLLIVIGSDRIILKTLLQLGDKSIPLLCLNGRKSRGFLTVGDVENIVEIVKDVLKGDYTVEKRIRLYSEIGDKILPPALNEIAVFSKLSGKIIRYSLSINGEYVWRDEADGVIVATPTGSTAYALSAGGPIVKNANVFTIVPVNTLIPTHKPIVTSSSNTITIGDLKPGENVLIIDGQIRVSIDSEEVYVRKSSYCARFIKPSNSVYDLDRRLVKRALRSVRASLENLPPSAKLVYKVLEYEGPLTTREIRAKTGLPARTVSYALKRLLTKKLVVKKPYSRDPRKSVYMLNVTP